MACEDEWAAYQNAPAINDATPLSGIIDFETAARNLCNCLAGDDPHKGEICDQAERVSQVAAQLGQMMAMVRVMVG